MKHCFRKLGLPFDVLYLNFESTLKFHPMQVLLSFQNHVLLTSYFQKINFFCHSMSDMTISASNFTINATDDDEGCNFDDCYTEQALIFIPEVCATMNLNIIWSGCNG